MQDSIGNFDDSKEDSNDDGVNNPDVPDSGWKILKKSFNEININMSTIAYQVNGKRKTEEK